MSDNESVLIELPAKLRAWRAAAKSAVTGEELSQAEAAMRLGVCVDTFRRWERGERRPQGLANLAAVRRELRGGAK